MKIAVIGAGIAGITAAYLLGKRHDVTLFERNDYIGGHTNTISVRENGREVPVDTGFIVCNPRTYPLFYRLMGEWGVALRDSDMSFGFCCERSGLGYVGPSVREFLRKPSNAFNLRLLGMIREQRRFGRRAAADLERGALLGLTLGEYLRQIGASSFFIENYLIPIAAAVWSSPDTDMSRFPAHTFIRFLANHGMLVLRHRPTWQTVVGGSHTYVKAFRSLFHGRVLTGAPVQSVRREDDGVFVSAQDRDTERFDYAVLATHADETLALLADATEAEGEALSAWRYWENDVQLHADAGVMPTDRRLWASWNYHRRADADPAKPLTMTYYMNRLQGLRSKRDYLVSLNARRRVDPEEVIYSVTYTHPGYTARSIEAQRELREMNGSRRTFFCGAHLRYGFHEDAVASAVDVTRHFGIDL
ncbi:MAG: FAD-dependent oxidoreductase [Planctomycetota bacterium]|nr:FAD-dependent oxidoreductase [Planctomycetota bacterium]